MGKITKKAKTSDFMENVEESEFSYIADGMVKVHSVWNTILELHMKINIYLMKGSILCP